MECSKENNVDESIWKQKSLKILPEEQNIKCFLKCVMVKMGEMDADGTLHKESIIVKFKNNFSDHSEELVKCLDVTVAEPCDKAYAIHKCMIEII